MMKNPQLFFRTVYLGDRACKAILINTWDSVVRMQIDLISRIRSASGNWDFYSDEDVKDGFLVFQNVKYFSMTPTGFLPNDLINSISVEKSDRDGLWEFCFGIDSADDQGESEEVQVKIVAESVCIENENGLEVAE